MDMGVWKSLVERMRDTRDEFARKAAKKVARTALDSAGKAVGSAGNALERALFGDDARKPSGTEQAPKVDPFAKLKAAEAERKARERREKERVPERAADKRTLDEVVDAESAAMQKKLRK
jgi:hypothetical protein